MQPLNGPEVVVGVGDCRLAAFPTASLSTYALGSCIALIGYDWKIKTGGLLHVMLPESAIDKTPSSVNPFVYVDTGVPELFRRLNAAGCGKQTLRWCVVGGASMMADSSHFEIGKRNYLAMKKAFWRHGIFVDREDVGGKESRSVRLGLDTGQIDLRKGGAREQIFVPAGINVIGRSA
jgi:chemotaxis protein CheD